MYSLKSFDKKWYRKKHKFGHLVILQGCINVLKWKTLIFHILCKCTLCLLKIIRNQEKSILDQRSSQFQQISSLLNFCRNMVKHVTKFPSPPIWPWQWTVKNNQIKDSEMSYSSRSQSTTPSANELMLMKNIMVGRQWWCADVFADNDHRRLASRSWIMVGVLMSATGWFGDQRQHVIQIRALGGK